MSAPRLAALLCAFLGCIAQQTSPADAANILGVFTSHSPSHLIVHMSVARSLAERGHNVTVVCSQKPKVNHESINVIIIPPKEEDERMLSEQMSVMATKENNIFTTISNVFGSLRQLIDMQVQALQDERFIALYENPATKFDLVIMGYFMNDYQMGVAAKFKCPLIVSWMGAQMELVDALVGNPREVAYVPNMYVSLKQGERMGFVKRLQNLFASAFFKLLGHFIDYSMEKYYTQLFPTDNNFPTYYDMKKNVSLVFCNSHFSEGPIRPNVPALVEIGGIQIKDKPDPLPKDIADFLNSSAKTGAILFSLGSNLQSTNIQPETINIIFKTLSALPQKVIWKWEDSNKTPGDAPNIMYKKWLPQDDILAHPYLKLFITHAGKGGLAEAQYHGVPMVALPVFADQNTNADKMVANGYGLQCNMLKLNVEDFTRAIKEVLSNESFAANVRKFSKLYRDRPMSAKQNVVFWTEYVLRHHGAAHMQSPLVHLSSVASANLDVIALVLLIAYVLWRLTKLVLKFAFAKLCKKSVTKQADKKVKKQ